MGEDHEITAIEIDPRISAIYKAKFPNDKVINTDAHFYLLDNYDKFDFIWSSPPCPIIVDYVILKKKNNI